MSVVKELCCWARTLPPIRTFLFTLHAGTPDRVAVQAIPTHLAHNYEEEQELTKTRQWSHQGGRTPLPLASPDSIVEVQPFNDWLCRWLDCSHKLCRIRFELVTVWRLAQGPGLESVQGRAAMAAVERV